MQLGQWRCRTVVSADSGTGRDCHRARVITDCGPVCWQEVELLAVKTKGGLRFVSPSSAAKKSAASVTPTPSVKPDKPSASVQPQPTATAAAAAAAARGSKQSTAANVTPASHLAKVIISSFTWSPAHIMLASHLTKVIISSFPGLPAHITPASHLAGVHCQQAVRSRIKLLSQILEL